MPNVENSSRHSKITQDFAEAAVFYWLSKCGFKCSKVDQKGIAIIAKKPNMKERFGVLVKIGNGETNRELVSISERELKKVKIDCTALKCIPCIAVLIEQKEETWILMSTLKHLSEMQPYGTATVAWKMTQAGMMQYLSDNEILAVELNHKVWTCW